VFCFVEDRKRSRSWQVELVGELQDDRRMVKTTSTVRR